MQQQIDKLAWTVLFAVFVCVLASIGMLVATSNVPTPTSEFIKKTQPYVKSMVLLEEDSRKRELTEDETFCLAGHYAIVSAVEQLAETHPDERMSVAEFTNVLNFVVRGMHNSRCNRTISSLELERPFLRISDLRN